MRRDSRLSWLAAPALALLASCAHEGGAGVTSSSDPADAVLCGTKSFPAFLQRFAEDPLFQERHTATKLRRMRIQNEGFEEPHPVETTVPRAQLQFPIFPSAARRKEYRLDEMTTEPEGSRMKVRVAVPDTDIVQVYYFERRSCWQLVRDENLTL